MDARNTWPKWAKQYLKESYTQKGNDEIALDLNSDARTTRSFTSKSVEKQIYKWGLKRTKEQLDTILQRNAQLGKYQKPKGYEAPNAVAEGDIRRWQERMRNGSIRETFRIKKGGKLVSLSRHLWEEANGPIPKGHLVGFLDSNPLNCVLGNLHLLTRAKNIATNKHAAEIRLGHSVGLLPKKKVLSAS